MTLKYLESLGKKCVPDKIYLKEREALCWSE